MPSRDVQIVRKTAADAGVVRHVTDQRCGHEWDIPPATEQKDAQGRFVCPHCAPGA